MESNIRHKHDVIKEKTMIINKKSNKTKADFIITYTTKDYSLFKTLDGNRVTNKLHVNKLKKSMEENYLYTLIFVNEKNEVIDGQHRLQACKELKLPVNYIVLNGYGLKEVQKLNANTKQWSANDYMNGYCDLGYKNYIIYRDYKNKYGFGHNETQALLSGKFTRAKHANFNDGGFKILDLKKSIYNAELIIKIAPFYKNYRRRSFVYSMLHLLEKQDFNYCEFLNKLKIQPTKLVDCVNQEQYTMLIEEIYNYKRREKVNLRY